MASSNKFVGRRSTAGGTLMWIGQRDHVEFKDIFRRCESQVPQLALRRDLGDAILRPASDVAGIIVTRQTRTVPRIDLLSILVENYPDANLVQLLGAMCEGERPRPNELFAEKILYCHQADQFLPQWLQSCSITAPAATKIAKSVAVITQSAQIAEPLMDLASSVGAAAFWCRQPNASVARNVDTVWWDDSAADGGTPQKWRERLANISTRSSNRPTHVWLTNFPRTQLANAAYNGGVDFVISKPLKIDALLQTIRPAQITEEIQQNAPTHSRAA